MDGAALMLFLDALSPDLASQGGTGLAGALRQGGELLSASDEAADRVLIVFTDGEGHDSLADIIAQSRQLKQLRIRLVLVAEGGTKPARIPVRDSTGTITEYQTDDEGHEILTTRRDDILQAISDAAEASMVPAQLPDQAGAVRDLLSAFARAPSRETRTADLLPLAWIPIAGALLLLGLHTVFRRTAALVALAGLLLAPRAHAQRLSPGRTRAGRRSQRGSCGSPAQGSFQRRVRHRRITMPALRHSWLDGTMRRALSSSGRPTRSIRISGTAPSTIWA